MKHKTKVKPFSNESHGCTSILLSSIHTLLEETHCLTTKVYLTVGSSLKRHAAGESQTYV